MKIAKVIVRTPLWRDLDYLIPGQGINASIMPGQRVLVPFGKRQVVGIVLQCVDTSAVDPNKLKELISVLEDQPILSEMIIRLCLWASDYYHYPLGEVIFGALPLKCRQPKLLTIPPLKSIESNDDHFKNESSFELSDEQKKAIQAFRNITGFGGVLLHGVTGSGKTEVYLQAIMHCVRQGKQALVLVPEISLTPQTVQRFQARFKGSVITLHSGLKDSERFKNWLLASGGEAQVVIGTRSSVFVPMPYLGLIIVDEEHDASFKQQSGFRYNARDVAVMRAYQGQFPIMLGSATPSLESLYNAWHSRRYAYITLPMRAGQAVPPTIHLLDIREQRLTAGMSEQLFSAVDRHLESGGQVLFFLNRRGYAPVLLCHHCGFSMQCPRCDAFLTYHQNKHQLLCHHCDYATRAPKICLKCHQADLMPVGLGTERLEETLHIRFRDKAIIRVDRDTTRKKGSLEALLSQAHANEAPILIGTQMLAKGHHFNNLTMVAIVDADSGLLSTDFRALERLAQLLVQVSGRAGRENKKGEVFIQTHFPEHPMLHTLLKGGYTAFSKELLMQRQIVGLPPYSHLALFRAEDVHEVKIMSFLTELKALLNQYVSPKVTVLGPIEAAMSRRAGKCRAQLLVQSECRRELQTLLTEVMSNDWLKRQRQKIHWSLDVDPVDIL